MNDLWLTTDEAAEQSGYHVVHIRRLVNAGKIKAVKRGRDWLINRESLMEYVRESEAQGHKRGPKK